MANDNTEQSEDESGLDRRSILKLMGAGTAGSTLVPGLGGTAAAQDYTTVTVPAGEEQSYTLGSGDTLEDLLIDVTAEGADLHITARGDGWAIRNVGVLGAFDLGDDSVATNPDCTGGQAQVIDATGNGVIENVYLGDGVVDCVDKTAMIVQASHAGHIEFRDSYVAEWSSNGIYAAGFGRINPPGSTDGAGGTIAFRNCYFRDNNVASLRLAADGTLVEDCVFTNTNNVHPIPETHGGVENVANGQGIYTGYGDPSQHIHVTGSHFEITEENTCAEPNDYNVCNAAVANSGTHNTYGELSEVHFHDSCEIVGETVGEHVIVDDGVGDDPDTSIPDGVPTDALEGAEGVSGGAGSGDTTPPDAPENLSSSGRSLTTIDLEWDGVEADDLDHYDVHVDGVFDHSVSAGTTATTVERLLAGTSYEFTVTATDDSFNESEPSNPVAVTTEDAAHVSEDFEHGDVPGTYSVDTETYAATRERSTSGKYALAIDDDADDPQIVMRRDMHAQKGDVYELDLYLASDATNDIGFLFGGQAGTTGWGSYDGYMGFFSPRSDQIRVDRWSGGGFERIPSTTMSIPSDEWITVRLDYRYTESETITMTVLDDSGAELGVVSLADETMHDYGEIGWYNYFADADWNADSWERLLFGRALPSTTDATVGERLEFDVEDATGKDRWIDSLAWDYGDGTTGTGWWNEHRYDDPGEYTVELTVTANDGVSTTHDVTITVSDLDHPLAEIEPSATEVSTGERLEFDAEDATGKDRWVDSLAWDFADGTTATGWWAEHEYAETGEYTVELTATDNTGQSTTDEVTISVS